MLFNSKTYLDHENFLSIIRISFLRLRFLGKLALLTHQSLYVKTWPRKPMKGSICFPIHSQSFEIKHFSHVTSNWIHSCVDTFIHDDVNTTSPLFLISFKIIYSYRFIIIVLFIRILWMVHSCIFSYILVISICKCLWIPIDSM